MGGNSDLIVFVSGFVRVCMDENGNEKRVSYLLLTLKERSYDLERNVYLGPLFLLVNFSSFGLGPILLLTIISCIFVRLFVFFRGRGR